MRRANIILQETDQIGTVEDLTAVFESIASTQVAKVREKVQLSKDFFQLLWQCYSSIRVDPGSRITSRDRPKENPRKVFIIISAESGLSGDIDLRLIETMLQSYDASTTDIIVLGSHGAGQLRQRGVPFIRYFQVPDSESYVDVSPVVKAIIPYSAITVYYEEYVSLGVQDIKKIDLHSRMQEMSGEADKDEDIITTAETIFEPSLNKITEEMEMMMVTLAFNQAILESNLAQNASRFNAMAQAKKRAFELLSLNRLEYHRSKRSESDRRLREVMVSLKKKKRTKKHA